MELLIEKLMTYGPPDNIYTGENNDFLNYKRQSLPPTEPLYDEERKAFSPFVSTLPDSTESYYNNFNTAQQYQSPAQPLADKDVPPTEPLVEKHLFPNDQSFNKEPLINTVLPPTEPLNEDLCSWLNFYSTSNNVCTGSSQTIPLQPLLPASNDNVFFKIPYNSVMINTEVLEMQCNDTFNVFGTSTSLIPTKNIKNEDSWDTSSNLPPTEPIFLEDAQKLDMSRVSENSFKMELLPPTELLLEEPGDTSFKMMSLPPMEPLTENNLKLNSFLPPTEPIPQEDEEQAIDLSFKSRSKASSPTDNTHPVEAPLSTGHQVPSSLATTVRLEPDSDEDEPTIIGITKLNTTVKRSTDNMSPKERGDMETLRLQLPQLDSIMQLERKVGEGTFSSVYLATLRRDPSIKFAVKHLTPTCHPTRIKRELQCLRDIGGQDNVCGINLCLRNKGCVVFIMPYQPHCRFHDYVLEMDAAEARLYMKNLLLALRRVHSFGIIHRDVKPGNFLYDRINKQFLLVDFGLAQSVDSVALSANKKKQSPTPPPLIPIKKPATATDNLTAANNARQTTTVSATPVNIQPPMRARILSKPQVRTVAMSKKPSLIVSGKQKQTVTTMTSQQSAVAEGVTRNPEEIRKRKRNEENLGKSCITSMQPPLKRVALQPQIDNRRNILLPPKPTAKSIGPQFQLLAPPSMNSGLVKQSYNVTSFVRVQNSRVKLLNAPLNSESKQRCLCYAKGQLCALCLKRPKLVAPRAGTPGFRPPEVLLKSLHQTTAVDMWAAGVLLLSILSGCYPFFRSPDDISALSEVMTVLGTKAIKNTAHKLDRMLTLDVERHALDLHKMCVTLRTNRMQRANKKQGEPRKHSGKQCTKCSPSLTSASGELPCLCPSPYSHPIKSQFPPAAYDLLKRLLDPDPDTRITAEEALHHPFLNE